MTPSQFALLIVIIFPLVLVNMGRLRIDVAALLIAVLIGTLQALGFGVLGPVGAPEFAARAVSGFGQPAVLTLLGLFILTSCLDRTGITRVMAGALVRRSGNSEARLVVLFATASAALSLIINSVAAAALILPGAMEASRQAGLRPSRLLMPVAFASLLGGGATYFTTANIIASNLLQTANPPQEALHILAFTPTGGLIAIVGIVFLGLFSRRLLPERKATVEQRMARPLGADVEAIYELHTRKWYASVQAGSPLVGRTLAESGIGKQGVSVAAIWRGPRTMYSPSADEVLKVGDVMLLIGRAERVRPLEDEGLVIKQETAASPLRGGGVALIELVLAPRSSAEGQTLKELDLRKQYGFTAMAILRQGRSYRTDVADMPLAFGDTILAVGDPARAEAVKSNADFLALELDTSDTEVNRRNAIITGATIAATVIVSILGFPPYLAVLAGALFVVLLRLIPMEDAYRAVDWRVIFLVAGMYAMSLALVSTGLADRVGAGVLGATGPFGPLGLAAGAFLLSALLTQIMGGQVAILVSGPILIHAALVMGVNPQAIAVAAAIGCSASFITPIAHPVNMLMMGPGGYRAGDFVRLGLPLTFLSFVLLLVGMQLFWTL